LLKQIRICQSKLSTETPTLEHAKLQQQLQDYQQQLIQLEADNGFHEAESVVAQWIANPPTPLTDLRRADTHRITYVGKKTKKRHSDDWKELVATSNIASVHNATAAMFRSMVSQKHDELSGQ
jgi:hypothetical protein